MVKIRIAQEADVPSIREVYEEVYGRDYPYRVFYDEDWLKRSVFNDGILMLVAEEPGGGRILGTASVIFDVGAYSDLVGEFGRLAVRPDAQRRGIGRMLMQKRIDMIQDRLHLAVMEARVVHPYAQNIALRHGFAPVGFEPLKHYFMKKKESLVFMVRYFGDALALRRNNPRIVSQAWPLANLAMDNLSIRCDAVVDESAEAYPAGGDFELKELTSEGLPSLLRIERGRVRNRELFGHMRLEYGFFKLRVGSASYLLACDESQIFGAIGFILDHIEHTVRVFELISSSDRAIRFLLGELERKCREEWGVEYLQADVGAHSARMQRTLVELNFLPVAYVPAMVFQEVERLDVIRMVRLTRLQELGELGLTPEAGAVAERVMRGFRRRTVAPRIAKAAAQIPLFKGMNEEQLIRLASTCSVTGMEAGKRIFSENQPADKMYIVLEGRVAVGLGDPPARVGTVEKGETLGEVSLLSSGIHSASATADTNVEAAVLSHEELAELIRQRPDIGTCLYRNLAAGLGDKLLRSDAVLRERLLNRE
jgi:GNAT superfamily N-acetyltransferase